MTLSHPLSMQLYSARKFPPVDEQLATIRRSGYANVEPFGPFYDDVAQTRTLLQQHGLSAKSGHFALAMAEQQPDRVLEIAQALGIEIIVVPYLLPEERPADAAGWAALGQRLAAIGAWFGPKGLRVAWHNHDFEFAALPDGSLPIEHVLGNDLAWEADLAWVVRGGGDPETWVRRYRGRIPLVHVKDIALAGANLDQDGWADVGAGVLPWGELWTLCVAAGAEAMIAEHDNPSDFERFARVSAGAMRRFHGDR